MSEIANLQFDRVEAADHSPILCAACKNTPTQSYYEINGDILCASCRERLEDDRGSGLVRFVKASAAGFGVAIGGALLWWGVRTMTGYEIGIISIAIGIGVGRAVRWGSQRRGGWLYQLLAIFLTYAAIAGNYTPDVVQQFMNDAESKTASQATAAPKDKKAGDGIHAGEILLGIAAIFLIAAIAPFAAGASNIIGWIIIAFGLCEAWKINRKVEISISGPFTIAPPAAPNV